MRADLRSPLTRDVDLFLDNDWPDLKLPRREVEKIGLSHYGEFANSNRTVRYRSSNRTVSALNGYSFVPTYHSENGTYRFNDLNYFGLRVTEGYTQYESLRPTIKAHKTWTAILATISSLLIAASLASLVFRHFLPHGRRS